MRELSPFEKEIVERIHSEESVSFQNLIDPYLERSSICICDSKNESKIIFEKDSVRSIDIASKYISEIQPRIVQMVNLIQLLEDKGYLYTFVAAHKFDDPMTYGTAAMNVMHVNYVIPDRRISEMLRHISKKYISKTPELDVFISNGYIPREESRFRKSYSLSQKAIALSLFGMIINLGFNINNCYSKRDFNQPESRGNGILPVDASFSFNDTLYQDTIGTCSNISSGKTQTNTISAE